MTSIRSWWAPARRPATGRRTWCSCRLDDPSDLARIAELRSQIASDGAIWVIRPKGRADLTEAMVLGAGRDAGMYDVKTARVSATHTGLKFVIPVADRA